MAGLTDDIEKIIRHMLDENNGLALIGRNELAGRLHCVPSQINYVLTTRFTLEQGYYVESRRGGGGGIRITRIHIDSASQYLQKIQRSIGDGLTEHRCNILLKELSGSGFISAREAKLLGSSYSEKALKQFDPAGRLMARSNMMRNMLSCLMTQRGGTAGV
ncbi:MAG: CtsR family transcriptional regulator [Saccharofermentanales bacterium]